MASQVPTELESFHRFLTEQLERGGKDLSPEESLNAFRVCQRELARLKQDIQPAVQRSLRGGGGRELDYDAFEQDGARGLAEKGITE